MSEQSEIRAGWFDGWMTQNHPRFGEQFAALVPIAGWARADHVDPSMLAAAMTWNHVVNRQVMGLHAAVLAREIIAPENCAPREFDVRTRAMDLIAETNHRRSGKFGLGGVDVTATIQNDFGFAADEEDDGTVGRADIQRLVILI